MLGIDPSHERFGPAYRAVRQLLLRLEVRHELAAFERAAHAVFHILLVEQVLTIHLAVEHAGEVAGARGALARAARDVRTIANEGHGQRRIVDGVHAYREGEIVRVLGIVVVLVDVLHHRFDARVHGFRILKAQHHVERIGRNTSHELAFAQMVLQPVQHVTQHAIAAVGTLDFVEQLELLDIDGHKRVRARCRLVDGLTRRQVEPRLVEAPGHRIDERQFFQLVVRLLQTLLRFHKLGDIGHRGIG